MVPSSAAIGKLAINSGAQLLRKAMVNSAVIWVGVMRSVRDKPEPLSSTKPLSSIALRLNHPRISCSPRVIVFKLLSVVGNVPSVR